jgi:hypothetical protein
MQRLLVTRVIQVMSLVLIKHLINNISYLEQYFTHFMNLTKKGNYCSELEKAARGTRGACRHFS